MEVGVAITAHANASQAGQDQIVTSHLLQLLLLHIPALQLKSSSTQQIQLLLHWCLRPASLAVSMEGPAVWLILSEVASAHQATVGIGVSMKKVSLRADQVIIILCMDIFRRRSLCALYCYYCCTCSADLEFALNSNSCSGSLKDNQEEEKKENIVVCAFYLTKSWSNNS